MVKENDSDYSKIPKQISAENDSDYSNIPKQICMLIQTQILNWFMYREIKYDFAKDAIQP